MIDSKVDSYLQPDLVMADDEWARSVDEQEKNKLSKEVIVLLTNVVSFIF